MESLLVSDVISEVGCHLTWPELQKTQKDQVQKSHHILENRKIDFIQLPTYFCSIKNLQGFILYSLDEVKKAEEKFLEVLLLDPSNICATGNLAVLYKRQSRMRYFHECCEKLRKLLADRNPVHLARAFADHAHAVRHFEQDIRCFSYTAFIKKAVEIGAETNVPERAEWLFDYGLALYRKDHQLVAGQAALAVTEPSFKEAVVCFASVTNMPEAPSAYRALSWVFIGILLRTKRSRSLGQALPKSMCLHSYTPRDCYEQALSINSDNPIVLRRVASELTLMKEYERAGKLFQESLEREPSWFAHRHLGLLCLAMYEDSTLRIDGDDVRRQLLSKAQDQFEIALTFKQVHADHSDLGFVFFLRGDYEKAVQQFSLAVRCNQDDYFNISITHSRWGHCLQKMGEEDGANLQFAKEDEAQKRIQKQVNALEAAFSHSHGTNCCGFECDLSRFDYCSSERPGYVNILTENYTPLTYPVSTNRRDRSPFKFDFFVSFSHIDHKWTVAFVRKLEKTFNMRGCIRYRDYEYGATIAENIAENIELSYRTIMIITPDSLRDYWCRYELQRAHMETLKRPCVVPIMLRPCKLPREVENLTHLRCNRGQFLADDWYRIHETLKMRVKKEKFSPPLQFKSTNKV